MSRWGWRAVSAVDVSLRWTTDDVSQWGSLSRTRYATQMKSRC